MGNSDSSASHSSAPLATNPQPNLRPSLSNAQPSAQPNQSNNSVPANPGAYRMPGRPSNQRFYVTIPRGVRPGQHFAVLVNGQQMMVRCPEDNRPGDRLIVTAPRQQAQQYVVTVPTNVRPGQQFRVMINNQEVMVTCPRGVRPGQRVTFQLPQQDRAPATSPNHQMFEVIVPEGVKPGQPFALIANNQRVMVTCPPNVKSGQKIRFQLPIQLSQQQLEAIRVNYDKDGWMRCLGQDLKFHWVYNKSDLTKKEENIRIENSRLANKTYIDFDVDSVAYVRELLPKSSTSLDIKFITATEYSLETSVKGTSVSYQEINSVATLPFQQKVDWLKNQFSALRVPWEEGHIKIRVRREALLHDAMDAIESIEVQDIKKVFRYEFIGEPALDAGGVTREFYQLICQQLCNPDIGLFQYSSANQMCMQFNPNSGIINEHHLRYFHMFGRILGKALMDNQITPVHFVQPMYKHMMGWPITLRDLEHIDDVLYKNLTNLLTIDDLSMLELDFTTTEDQLGHAVTVPLLPNGANITVTKDNLPLYLESQLKYRLHDRIALPLSSFLRGLYDVIPEPLLAVFDFQELELLLHGLPNIDMDDWIRNAEYTGEFSNSSNGPIALSAQHKVVQWFWDIVKSMEQEHKAKLLQFVTGTAGVPVQGFGYLQGNDGNIRKFTIHGDKNVKSKAEMQKYLFMAISMESSGFDIE
eukprot:gene20157-26170_t